MQCPICRRRSPWGGAHSPGPGFAGTGTATLLLASLPPPEIRRLPAALEMLAVSLARPLRQRPSPKASARMRLHSTMKVPGRMTLGWTRPPTTPLRSLDSMTYLSGTFIPVNIFSCIDLMSAHQYRQSSILHLAVCNIIVSPVSIGVLFWAQEKRQSTDRLVQQRVCNCFAMYCTRSRRVQAC